MNIILWILQIFLGLYFVVIGVMHFAVPPGLPPQMAWMYELQPWLHWVSGIAETTPMDAPMNPSIAPRIMLCILELPDLI